MAADLALELEGAKARIAELMAEGQVLATEKHELERAARDKELNMATAIATSLARSGYGSTSGSKDNDGKWKSTVKMPTFRKDGSEDFLLFYGRFEAWSALQNFNGHQQKLSLFMSFEGEAAAIARIFGPETENFSKPYHDYTRLTLKQPSLNLRVGCRTRMSQPRHMVPINCQCLWWPTQTQRTSPI